jgi:DNA-binding beta-propeller fold protein YncE
MERHRTGTSRHVVAGAGLLLTACALAACADTRETQAADETQVRVEAFSGSGEAGLVDGDARTGQLNRPHGLALDRAGNVYVSDRGNHAIRVVTPDGSIRTLAGGTEGNADGTGAKAAFRQPIAVVVDAAGHVYVADRDNHSIRVMDPSGQVTTVAGTGAAGFADGPAAAAQFNQPYGLALSPDDRTLYIADYLNHAIRAIDFAGRQVTTLAGDGTAGLADGAGRTARFHQPYNVKADARGRLFVPDQNNHAIRRVDPDGTVTTLAGNGQPGVADGLGPSARFDNPTGLTVAPDGTVYVADRNNHRIRAIDAAGQVRTLAGDGTAAFRDGPAQQAQFNRPLDVVMGADGALVVSEEGNHRLRKVWLR